MSSKIRIILLYMLLAFALSACKKDKINENNTNFCINNSCDPTETVEVIADGISKSRISFRTDVRQFKQNNIIFSVSNGSLVPLYSPESPESTKTLKVTANDGSASAYFISSKDADDLVTVTAILNETVLERKIKLVKSFPDSIYITTESYINPKTEIITVTAHLMNFTTGFVSDKISVYFSVSSNNPNLILKIPPIALTSKNESEATAAVELRNFNNDTGRVEITAHAQNQQGNKITGKHVIKFQ